MMEYALACNSTTLAISILNATSACIAMKVADVSSTRRLERDALLMRHAAEKLCAFMRQLCQPMACARRSCRCQRTH